MKTKILVATAAVALAMAGCTGSKDDEGRKEFRFTTFNYEKTAVINPDSLEAGTSPIIAVQGQGVYPVSIYGQDISALCAQLDTLSGLKGGMPGRELEPQLPANATSWEGDSIPQDPGASYTSNVEIVLANPDLIVFRAFNTSYFQGAAHGLYATSYVNYYIPENKVLTLHDIVMPESEPKLVELLKEGLAGREDVFPDVEIGIPPTFEVTPEGLDFIYSLYEIAPYSSGEIQVHLEAYSLYDLLTSLGRNVYGFTD